MNILHILAHPDYANANRTANQLAETGIALTKTEPNAKVEIVNLYDPEIIIPRINAESLTVRDPNLMSAAQKALYLRQQALLAQWKKADHIFIYAPIHNFNVPSQLKDYFDNVLMIGETFAFTEKGYVGLMSDKTKVTAVLTSGSDFSTDFRYQALDIAPQFLRVALHNMGIHNLHLIRAQGLDILGNDRQQITEQAKDTLSQHIQQTVLNG